MRLNRHWVPGVVAGHESGSVCETFTCNDVAARFGDEEGLFRILDRLISPPYLIKKLETFMCDGVAARFCDEEGLFRILDRLISPPYSIKKLETFMCDSVAARFSDEEGFFRIMVVHRL